MLMDLTPPSKDSLANWIKKEDPKICHLQETHLINRNKYCFRVKGWKKICQASGLRKQAGVAILISDKIDIKLTLTK
jgi:exonuclease III